MRCIMIELPEKLEARVRHHDNMGWEENILQNKLNEAKVSPHKAAIYRCLIGSLKRNRNRLLQDIGPHELLC
jgi:hypothetical protein